MKSSGVPILLLSALAAAVSCRSGAGSEAESAIPYVRSVLSNPEGREYRLLESFDPSRRDAAIYVVGDLQSCLLATGDLSEADDRDNIDALPGSDLLPDFAGETIALFADVAGGAHDSLLLDGRGDVLRELTVRSVLKCLDTLCYLSPFDADGLGHKSHAKIVVLADPAAAFYGMYDVDSLLSATRCALPVVSPLYTLSREMIVSDGLNVGVIAPEQRAQSGMYADVFLKAAAMGGFADVSCTAYPAQMQGDILLNYLDRYIEDGHTRPLDFLLVDVPGVDIEAMTATLERVRSVMNEESLRYASCIAPDFRFVQTSSVLRRECYNLLRERNLFTHRIAYPLVERYLNVSRSSSDELDDNILIEFNSRFIPQ